MVLSMNVAILLTVKTGTVLMLGTDFQFLGTHVRLPAYICASAQREETLFSMELNPTLLEARVCVEHCARMVKMKKMPAYSEGTHDLA